ncbi:MAG: RluA family pseudouridine synthase [Clostridia bacterium]|nr:RluA family pseudouridine synthase [Clostridia bacterium]
MKTLIVEKKYNEKKLSKVLFDKFEGLTNNTFNKALRKKDIRINNIRVSENKTVYEGDEIKVYIVDELLLKKAEIQKIEIVYEDSNIVVFNKPAGIEVTGENSLESYAKQEFQSPNLKPCHRLDRNTTGLVLFAKDAESLEILLKAFKEQKITKHYRCTVVGIPKTEFKVLEAYLFKDTKKSVVYISDVPKTGYRKIITSYKIIKKDYENNLSLLDVELHTGRTHQIRAHLAHIGYPILGDGKYGINSINKKFSLTNQQLCSYSLEFNFDQENNKLKYLNKKIISLNLQTKKYIQVSKIPFLE